MAAAALAILAAYLVGSIPFGVLFARARGIDLRRVGSGNIGATNAARALGKRAGLAVFVCDAGKGVLPVLLARRFVAVRPGSIDTSDALIAAIGFAAFVGHLAPPWLRFRGGKGVATAFGVFLALAPGVALVAGGAFAVIYAVTRISSLGSLAGATLFVPALGYAGGSRPALVAAGAMWALIVVKHRGNIGRLLRRQENKL